MEYDVYYSTGGGSLIGGGADVWVNDWIENIAPHLDVKPILAIHRTRPPEFKNDLGIEVVWQGDDVKGFGELLKNAFAINLDEIKAKKILNGNKLEMLIEEIKNKALSLCKEFPVYK